MRYFAKPGTGGWLRHRAWALLLLLTFGGWMPGIASAASYWSLGSFKSEANALRERSRLESATGLMVRVARSGDLYRVVVEQDYAPQAQKDAIERIGITPWTLSREDIEILNAIVTPVSSVDSMAAPSHFLVLASFTDPSSAEMLRARLAEDGVGPLEIASAEVQGRTYHRILQGPFESRVGVRDEYAEYGIMETWWLRMERSPAKEVAQQTPKRASGWEEAERAYVGMAAVASQPEPGPDVVPEFVPETVYTISPPSATESYVVYCASRANAMERAIFCRNGTFARLSNMANDPEGSEEAHLIYCAIYATGEERREQCRK